MPTPKTNSDLSLFNSESVNAVPVLDTEAGLRVGSFFKEGWIKLHRKIRDNWIWQDPVKFQWWIDILLEANHKSAKVLLGFELVECGRGQTIRSLQGWADRWGVSRDTARNFLKLLVSDGMILHESLTKSTRITICNYDSYQLDLHNKQTQSKRKANAKQTLSDTNKNEKNEKNEKNILYQSAIDIYCKWIENDFGFKAKIDGAQGNALKSILSYLKKFRGNNQSDDDQVLRDLEAIFKHWKRLDKFIQGQTKLTQINSNLQNIINQLKNETNQRYGITDNEINSIITGLNLPKTGE